MDEIWKPVPGFVKYEVSNLGRVRRCVPGRSTRIGKVLKPQPKNGYFTVLLSGPNGFKHRSVHRLVAAAFLGPCPDGYEVNHKDRVRSNNRLDNLEYMTPSDQQRHAWQTAEKWNIRPDRATRERCPCCGQLKPIA